MARSRIGGVNCAYVLHPEHRVWNLRQLLISLSQPNLCLVIGSGASYGVMPMTHQIRPKLEKAQNELRELLQVEDKTSGRYVAGVQGFEAKYGLGFLGFDQAREVSEVSERMRRIVFDLAFSAVFTASDTVPKVLLDIYSTFENRGGSIISYNYDRITEAQNRFRVFTPHGQRLSLLEQRRLLSEAQAGLRESGIRLDLVMPGPETEDVRRRPDYDQMLPFIRRAKSIVFVGYGFGSGDDDFSLKDFGSHASKDAKMHVLSPHDTEDLCKTIGYSLRNRPAGFKVYGQPFRWKSFAESLLGFLNSRSKANARDAIGHEAEIVLHHDWFENPEYVVSGRRIS